MQDAFDELLELKPDGIQLTPGNAPTEGFRDHVINAGIPIRTHHGFVFDAIRQQVWRTDHTASGHWDSMHPLHRGEDNWLPLNPQNYCLETMYPGEPLGSGKALGHAMQLGIRLAVDISHIFIQLQKGAMTTKQWEQLQSYEKIEEVHLSANEGRRDSHYPIEAKTFGLDWARNKGSTGIPVVLECYMHKLTYAERIAQIEIVRGENG